MKKFIPLVCAIGGLWLATGCATHHPASYDYVVYHDLSDSHLIKLGHEGWRLAGFAEDGSQGTTHTTYIMEKKIQ